MADNNPIDFSRFFNFDDLSQLNKFEKVVDSIVNSFEDLLKNAQKGSKALNKTIDELTKSIIEEEKALEKLNASQKEQQKEILKLANNIEKQVDAVEDLNKTEEEYLKQIKQLEQEVQELQKAQNSLNQSTKNAKKANEEQKGSLAELEKQVKEARKAFKSLGDDVDESVKQEALQNFARLNKQLTEQRAELREATKTIDIAENSYESWAAAVRNAERRLKKLEDPLGENREEAEKLKREINENKNALKQFDASIGNFQRNVGNYEAALNNLRDEFKKVSSAAGGASSALGAIDSSLDARDLLSVAGALAAITNALKTGESSAENTGGAFAKLTGLLNSVSGAVSKSVSGFIDIADAIITGEGNLFSLNSAIEKATGSFDNLSEKAVESAKAQEALFLTERENIKATIELEEKIATLNRQFEIQTLFADDSTRSLQERAEAAQRAATISIQLAEAERDLAKLEVTIGEARVDALKKQGLATLEAEQELAAARVQLFESETQIQLRREENRKQQAELTSDIIEQELDLLIDGVDLNKSILERRLSDERLLLNERIDLLQRANDIQQQSFKEQTEIINQAAKDQIDFNNLLLESDSRVVRERLINAGLSEVLTLRALEILKDQKTATQDLAEAERDLNEAQNEQIDIQDELTIKQEQLNKLRDTSIRQLKDISNFEGLEEGFELQNLENEVNALQRRIDARREANQSTIELENELTSVLIDIQKARIDQEIKLIEDSEQKKKQILDNEREIRKRTNDELRNLAIATADLLRQLNEQEIASQKQQLENFEAQKQRELEVEGLTTDQKLEIINDFNAKETDIQSEIARRQQQQAVFDKTLSVSQAIINVAQGISGALSAGPVGIPLAAIIAALGAVQIASIISTPIPQAPGFKDGVIDIQGPGTSTSDSINARLSKGESVLTAQETKSFKPTIQAIRDGKISSNSLNSYVDAQGKLQNFNPTKIEIEQVKEMLSASFQMDADRIVSAIQSQPNDVWDDKGYRRYNRTRNGYVRSLNDQSSL